MARWDEARWCEFTWGPDDPVLQKNLMKWIKLGLSLKSPAQKVVQGNGIKAKMTDNPNFQTPNPPLVAFGTVITNLVNAITARDNAVEAAKQATQALYVAEAAYDTCVSQEAAYAESITAGDPVKLLSGGFELRKDRVPVIELGQVQYVRLATNTHVGRLIARWDALPGALIYEVQMSTEPLTEASWKSVPPTTGTSTELLGLTSGQRVWTRVRGVNAGLLGDWSEPASKIVP